MTLKIDSCVAAWLWDIRHSGEQECTSILLAKSISQPIRRTQNNSVDSWVEESCRRTVVKQKSAKITESTRELILGGNILIQNEEKTADLESFSSEFDSGCGISLLPEEAEDSPNSSESDHDRPQQHLRLLPNQDDSSSLDSACGSSPIYCSLSENNSPVRSGSPVDPEQVTKPTLLPAGRRAGIPFLPSYANLRETLDQILLSANHLYSQLNELNRNPKRSGITFDITGEFVSLAENASCSSFVPHELFSNVKTQLEDLNSDFVRRPETFTAPLEFVDSVKNLADSVFCFFGKVIVRHLSEPESDIFLLPAALEHLTHVALFGEKICLEIVQVGGVNCLCRLCRQGSTPTEVLRLALRALAVLCSVSKGCIQLLSICGLDLVVKLLCEAPFVSAVEAAGVLTQLTAPCHSYAALPPSLPRVVSRLLDLCDQSRGSDAFLLCSAALANLSMQHCSVSELLYKENAVLRLSKAYNTATCQSIFAQDQIATIFARLSANGYNEALIAQGSIPCLLFLLQIHNLRHVDLCKRVRYKAAICLGTIASRSYGLKAINDNQGKFMLRKICKIEQGCQEKNDPVHAICYSLLVRLSEKYELESAV